MKSRTRVKIRRYDNYIEADDLYDIGYGYILHKEYEKAIPYLEKACRLNRDFFYAHLSLSYAYYRLGRYGSSKHVLWEYVKRNRDFVEGKRWYSALLYRLGDIDGLRRFVHKNNLSLWWFKR